MKRCLLAGGIALAVGLGWLAGALRAQDTLPPPRRLLEAPPQEYVAPVAVEAQGAVPVEAMPPGEGGPGCDHKHRGPICRYLASLGCWSHHNSYSCSSLKSECVFIFGSCRAWHCEPCFKSPPPIAAPPGYPPLTAHHYGVTVPGEGHRGCPCGQ
jgi:hypothetical protein